MLQQLDEALWIADMAAGKGGFEYGARMTVVRLPDRGLWVHSPVALTPDLKRQLDALGPVRHLVAPSRMHYEHVREFTQAYPEARTYATPALHRRPGGLRVRVDAELGEAPDPAWGGVFRQSPFRGSVLYEEVDFFHVPSRTLILTDLLFNIPATRSASTRFWAGVLGILGKPSHSRIFAMTARDRRAVRASLERILAWDFDRILLSHGDWVSTGGRALFQRAFQPFLG